MKKLLATTTLLSALLLAGCSDDPTDVNFPPGGNNGGGGGNPVLQPPLAVNDNYTVMGAGQLVATAANGVLANDTPNNGTVVFFQTPTTLGGNVAVNADGSFTYNAPAAAGNDTFTYRVQNAVGNSTATVTIAVQGRGFFVNNQAAAGGNGSQAQPFQNLAQALAAATGINGAEIVVFRGDGTTTGYNTQVNLGGNQTLRAFDANRPRLTGPVVLANGSTVSGVQLDATPGDAITGGNVSAVNIQNVLITNAAGNGVSLTNATGAVNLQANSVTNVTGRGLLVQANTGTLNLGLTNNTMTGPGRDGILCNATGATTVNWTESGTLLTNTGSAGVFQGSGWRITFANNSVLNATHTNSVSNGTSRLGYEFTATDASNTTVVMVGCNITGGVDRGVNFRSDSNALSKARFTNNRFNGNLAGFGFEAGPSNNSTMALRMNGNVADVYRFAQNQNTAPFLFENFANFTAENIGTPTVLIGTVTNVPLGSQGIP